MTGTVLIEDAGEGVRIVTLNRPQRLNAIVPELLDDLVAALEAADRDPAIGAAVLTGAGRAFCAGDDLTGSAAQSGVAAARRVAALPRGPVGELRRILARRHGGGLEAAMAAETDATVRGFLDPETARRVAAFG